LLAGSVGLQPQFGFSALGGGDTPGELPAFDALPPQESAMATKSRTAEARK
jgi:hypothetical protein